MQKQRLSKKKFLYVVESFSLPGPGDVKCDYEEVIEHEHKLGSIEYIRHNRRDHRGEANEEQY